MHNSNTIPSGEGTISGASERRGKTIDEMKGKYPARGTSSRTIPPAATFINESPNRFDDISSEYWREYDFGNGKKVVIEWPQMLSVSKSGGHRVFDRFGISHYIPGGWLHLSWEASPNFVK